MRPLNYRLVPLLIALLLEAVAATPVVAQQIDRNVRALRPYMQPYQVTKLEWELLQFNVLWSGSFSTPSSYLTSYPVFFDQKSMRFRTILGISEQRDYQDPEPWSRLARVKRESVLQGGVDQLIGLLSQSFPELKAKPELLLVEFKFRQSGGGFVNAAKFENGILSLTE